MSVTPDRPALDPAAPPAGPGPRAVAAAAVAGLVLALLLAGVGVLGVQDAVVHAGWAGGPSWAGAGAARFDGLNRQVWVAVVGVVAALTGIWLLVLAVLPRRATHLRAPTGAPVWIRPVDLARLAGQTARTDPRVIQATARATRRRVTLWVSTTDPDPDAVRDQVTGAVREHLAPVGEVLGITVKSRDQKDART